MKLRPAFLLTLSAFASTPFSVFADQPVRIVATGGRIGTTFYAPATTHTSFRQRTPHKLGGPVSEIQVGFMDWMYPYAAETPNDRNDVTLDHVWLERASTGQIVPLTFSGSRTLVLPMNSTTPYWLCDPVPSSAWTGTAPARDEVFWLHVRGSIPTGGMFPTGTPTTFPGARLVVYPPANDPGTFDLAGPVPSITGSSARTSGLPLVFLGRYTEPGHRAIIGVGDSILDGTGDIANPVPVISGYGFFNRAAVDVTGANTLATFNLTRHGQSASNFVNPSRQQRQTQFLPFANIVVEEYGTNDLGSGGTGNSTSILANTETIWSMARTAGVQKIIRTKLMPRTTSTDSWASVANQTPNPGWGTGGKRDLINTGLTAALAEGKIDILLDSFAAIGAPGDNSRWLTNGVAKYTTSDGTHVSAAGNALLGAALRTALLSLTVDETAPPLEPIEVVIDNSDAAPAFVASAGWLSSSGYPGFHGTNYLHDDNIAKGTKSALYTPDLASGSYAVSMRWSSHSNRADNVPVDIIHAGGIHSTTVNQKIGGGAWYPLGTYTFNPGAGHGLLIDSTGTSGYVIADAVKFTPAPGDVPGPSTPGTPFTTQSWTSAPWNTVNLAATFSASFSPDGTPVTLTFANPKTGVDITTPAAPVFTTAANSFFGFEGTGFGVANSGLGRFERGESFTLQATHAFMIQQIKWRELTGDEVLHIQWTQGGVSQQQLFNVTDYPQILTSVQADANTPVVITNVSASSAHLNGRLRCEQITTALVY